MQPDRLPTSVTQRLGHYVYLYIDPRDESVFYVGKGQGNRAFAHLKDTKESAKVRRIKEIEAEKRKVRIEILVHDLQDEKTALKVEASILDLLGFGTLTNAVRGYQSSTHGRMRLDQIKGLYEATPAQITEPTMLIRINRLYRHTMNPQNLYEATRGYWKVGAEREKVTLAMAVYQGIIREVYEVVKWFPAATTFSNRDENKARLAGRWEFVGRVADGKVRAKYLYRSVAHEFEKANQNPIRYLNIK